MRSVGAERSDLGDGSRTACRCRACCVLVKRDRLGVGHPVDVVLDRLDDAPHVGGRRVDRDPDRIFTRCRADVAQPAAASGATMFTEQAGAELEAGRRRRARGTTSTHQWNGPAWSRGAVSTTTLYAKSPSVARAGARACRASASASARDLVVGGFVEARAAVGERDAHHERRRRRGRAPRPRPASRTTHAAWPRDRVGHEIAPASRSGRARVDARAGRTSSATSCACGCSIDAPAALALVHERLRVHAAVRRDGSAARSRSASSTSAAASCGERAELGVVRGGEDRRPRARRATPSPTIGYLFGTTRSCPARRVGCARRRRRATSGGVSCSLPAAERTGRRRSPAAARRARGTCRAAARAPGARITRSPVSSSTRSCCIERSG